MLGLLFFVIPFVITQFMLNRAVSAVFTPICLLTCSALGANPHRPDGPGAGGLPDRIHDPHGHPAVPLAMADGGYDLKDYCQGRVG